MADFTAKDVQRLRQATGAGMMDAKRALEENGGDYDAASRWLRERGLAKAAGRTDREASQGAVAVAVQDGRGALVELRSETDFVAKSAQFTSLVDELADAVATKGEAATAEFGTAIDDLKIELKENISLGRVVRYEAEPGAVLDSYLHIQTERGVNGVLVEVKGVDQSVAHDIAVHIAFARPKYLTRDEVPQAEVDDERATLEAQTRNEGKPEQAIPKIVEGKLNGFFKERVLLEQSFVRDEKRSISQLLGSGAVTRFAQVEIGQ